MAKKKINLSAENVHEALSQWDASCIYRQPTNFDDLFTIVCDHDNYDVIAVDTETTSIDALTCNMLGYSFSGEDGSAVWVPIEIDPQLKALNWLVHDKKVIMANVEYDLMVLYRHGVLVDNYRDILIACFFADILEYRQNAGLKKQAQKWLGRNTISLLDTICANSNIISMDEDDIDFTLLTLDQQRIYACQDADITLALWNVKEIQKAIHQRRMHDIWELEHDLIPALMEMKCNGIGLDLKAVKETDEKLQKECKRCATHIERMLFKQKVAHKEKKRIVYDNEKLTRLTKKKPLNLGSFTQKQILLFDILDLPKTRKCASGYSTDTEALQAIASEHLIVKDLICYNQCNSRRNMYTQKLPKLLHSKTGKIHPTFWATGVKSGRFSVTNPPMQGISRDDDIDSIVKIRNIFVADKGYLLTSADYSQIELRIPASVAGELTLCNAYKEGTIDVHYITAQELFGIEKPNAGQRSLAKTVNFSILTGISAYTLAARNNLTVKYAQELIDKWFIMRPQIRIFIQRMGTQVMRNGYMETFFGRIRPFPDAKYPSPASIRKKIGYFNNQAWSKGKSNEEIENIAIGAILNECKRKALSHYIQGTAADLMKIAIINCYDAIQKERMPLQLILTVHDELLFHHVKGIRNEVYDLVQEYMTFPRFGPNNVPIPVDIGSAERWGECK